MIVSPTRAAGLERLRAFAPRMGQPYACHRNTDLGPERNVRVSGLSPWIRRRLVTEEEVARVALDTHGARGADKFLQEVLWRTYWKGWLEQRPEVWRRYELERSRLQDSGEAENAAARAARAGRTGIEGFDDWARELVETGWLHNHARMWFASIWIFTLKLPWELGADFFMRHLLDGDPASNTLSWRWVAGLQTAGKTYLATTENIERFTEGRFRPTGLATEAVPPSRVPPVASRPLRTVRGPVVDGAWLLLVTAEDLGPEHSVAPAQVRGVAMASEPGSEPKGSVSARFLEEAMQDAGARASARYGQAVTRLEGLSGASLVEAALAVGARGIATAYVPVGPTATALTEARPVIAAAGLDLAESRRAWDEALWPLADRGFFPFRERAPAALRALGLAL